MISIELLLETWFRLDLFFIVQVHICFISNYIQIIKQICIHIHGIHRYLSPMSFKLDLGIHGDVIR